MAQLLPPLCDDLDVGIAVYDPETGTIRSVNSRLETLTGYGASALRGTTMDSYSAADTATSAEAFQARMRAAADGDPQTFEWTLESAAGEQCHLRVQLSETTLDGDSYVLAEYQDISAEIDRIDRLETEEAVVKRLHRTTAKAAPFEEKVAELLEFGRTVMGVEQGFLTSIDEDTQTITIGVGPNEQLQDGAEAPFSESYCRHTIKPEEDSPMTVINARKEGWEDDPAFQRFGLGCYVGSELTVDGETVGTLCFADREPAEGAFTELQETFVDLLSEWASTELERVERERELRRKDRALEAAPVGITISDPDQEDNPMVYVNDQYEETTGYSEAEAVGRNCRFLQGEDTSEEPVAAMREAIANAEPVTVELRNYRKNGDAFWNRVSIAPVTDDDGTVRNFVGFQQDITEQKRKQEELKRSNERLQEFAYILSHDLQEPLRMVSSYVCLLEEELDEQFDEETQQYIDFAVDGAERMRGMIDGLLLYSRVETEGGEYAQTDVNEVLDAVRADLKLKLEEADADLVADAMPTLQADEDQLIQLFENLIKNAVEHGGEGTRVEVTATETADGHRFAVTDDGPGIPPEQQEDIFGLFDKGSDSDGTGMGLAICQRIVNRHNGEIWVDSEPGEGTTFYFTLEVE